MTLTILYFFVYLRQCHQIKKFLLISLTHFTLQGITEKKQIATKCIILQQETHGIKTYSSKSDFIFSNTLTAWYLIWLKIKQNTYYNRSDHLLVSLFLFEASLSFFSRNKAADLLVSYRQKKNIIYKWDLLSYVNYFDFSHRINS